MVGNDWRKCGSCGLGHSPRPDGLCPRCGRPLEARPLVEARPALSAGPLPETLTSGVYDPALVAPASPPPARLRGPAGLVAVAALAVAATAIVLDAPRFFMGGALGLGAAAVLIAFLARA